MAYAQSLDEDIPELLMLSRWKTWREGWFFEHPILNVCELVLLITCGGRVLNNNDLGSDQPSIFYCFYRPKSSDSEYVFWINRIRAESSFIQIIMLIHAKCIPHIA